MKKISVILENKMKDSIIKIEMIMIEPTINETIEKIEINMMNPEEMIDDILKRNMIVGNISKRNFNKNKTKKEFIKYQNKIHQKLVKKMLINGATFLINNFLLLLFFI